MLSLARGWLSHLAVKQRYGLARRRDDTLQPVVAPRYKGWVCVRARGLSARGIAGAILRLGITSRMVFRDIVANNSLYKRLSFWAVGLGGLADISSACATEDRPLLWAVGRSRATGAVRRIGALPPGLLSD